MGWLDRLFWEPDVEQTGDGQTDGDRPPKPESHSDKKEFELTRYHVEFEYQNGDSETVVAFSTPSVDASVFVVDIEPDWETFLHDTWINKKSFEKKKVPAEVLTRPPKVVNENQIKVNLTFTVEYEWGFPHDAFARISPQKKWRKDRTLDIVGVKIISDN